MKIQVRELFTFPVKSGGPIAHRAFNLNAMGPIDDRRWMVVDQEGKFITQRNLGRLAQLQPFQRENKWWGRLPSGRELPLEGQASEQKTVTIWKDTVVAHDLGVEWSGALSSEFGQPLRMVEIPNERSRALDLKYNVGPKPLNFADGQPILIVNQASVEALEQRMGVTLGALRFRPNIVIEGLPAFAEKDIRRWQISGIEMQFTKLCSRCVMTTLDPVTGEKQYPGLLKELAKDQMSDGKIYFGVHVVYQKTGRIAVGDEVRILS